MSKALRGWAADQRHEINQDLKWFNAGAKLFSPSGDDITIMKVQRLNEQLRALKDAMAGDDA